jgi:hypothetical protein
LRGRGVLVDQYQVAWLPDHDIAFQPLANVVAAKGRAVYGVVGGSDFTRAWPSGRRGWSALQPAASTPIVRATAASVATTMLAVNRR